MTRGKGSSHELSVSARAGWLEAHNQLAMKPRIRIAVAGAAALLACQSPTTPSGTGGLSLSAASPAANCGQLTDGRVQVLGPTNLTVSITPGTTKTISGLSPGTYTVGLEGLIGSDVDCFDQSTGVQVVAGQNTAVSETPTPFLPPVVTPTSAITFGRQFVVTFTGVARAGSYVIEWDTAATFSNPSKTSIATGTSVELTVADTGLYHVRARAVNAFGSSGRASPQVSTFVDRITSISTGISHTCAVTVRKAAYCWGADSSGQLGDGATSDRARPVPVAGSLKVATLSAGHLHTCAVDKALGAFCWGRNVSGQLGNGSTTDQTTPVQVVQFSADTLTALSAGFSHTCGAATGRVADCWGFNGDGELGDGTFTDRASPGRVTGGLAFATVSAGESHSCGVTTAGTAYCWGDAQSGKLGNGATTRDSAPVPVAGGLTFATVRVGSGHSCGLTTAGAAYCWGDNSQGQLGDGTMTSQPTPEAVAGGLTFVALSAGHLHNCGLTAAGAAYCWGANFDGQVGDGTTIRRTAPVVVAGLTFVALSAGGFHTCGVTAVGVAYCWGGNGSGQLGDGSTSSSPTPVRVSNPQ